MTMTLPIVIPTTPSAGASPASDDSSVPRTPLSPGNMQTLSLPAPNEQGHQSQNNDQNGAANALQNAAAMKRKPSRRANTAERRATHNAVERQRRETLNGRFLDLAALLPNLSQIRRPSKSAIVNSSIAHIHASRRHRLLAARELRLLKMESDALRRELNEWRDRAGLPRVDEPPRGEGFGMVMAGELEVIAAINEDDEDGYDDDDGFGAPQEDMRAAAVSMLKNANANPFSHNLPAQQPQQPHAIQIPRMTGPMIAPSPTSVSFENPAMAASYGEGPFGGAAFQAQHAQQQQEAEKAAAWFQMQQLQAQRAMYTPPASSHGLEQPGAYFPAFQRTQMMGAALPNFDSGDDASSVGSAHGRERSGSVGGRSSGYGGSPAHEGSFEVPGALGEYVSRTQQGGPYTDMGMIKTGSPISVGGGGNGTGFAMMM